MKTRTLARNGLGLAAATLLALALPLAASAHVKVAPDEASPGEYATLTFRVPTESNTASTVKVEVDLPTKTPFTSVSYQAVAGWSAKVVTEKLPKPVKIPGATVTEAPTKIMWTAKNGAGIEPGQFQQFVISAGKVPDTGSVLLPATQTYSDGTVVHWDQKASASGEEPEHPAPVLYINDSPPAAGDSTPSASPEVSTGSTTGTYLGSGTASTDVMDSSAATSADAALGIGLGIAGLALGAIAVVLSVIALTRRRSSSGGDRR